MANDQSFLELLQHMRSRPGMYIGGLNTRGLDMLVDGMIDDLLDAKGSKLTNALLTLERGRSFALELDCEVAGLRELSTCAGPLPWSETDAHENHGRSNPFPVLGFVIAAAFSSSMKLEVVQPDYSWRQRVEPATVIHPPEGIAFTGTPHISIRLQPDASLFPPEVDPSFFMLSAHMQEHAVTHAGAMFSVVDATTDMRRDYLYPRGLRDYLSEIAPPVFSPFRVFHLAYSQNGDSAEAVILDAGAPEGVIHTFVNGRRCIGGGSHEKGLRSGVSSVLSQITDLRPSLDPDKPLSYKTIVLSLRLREPQWKLATGAVLMGVHVTKLVREMVVQNLPPHIEREWRQPRT